MHEEERKTGPKIKAIQEIQLPSIQRLGKNGHIPDYFLEGNTEQIAKIELVFPAGRKYETKRAIAALTTMLLQEGTESKSSSELAELLDFYGFRFRARNDFDYAYVSISFLSKYFSTALDLLLEIILSPSFPLNEFEVAKKTASNNLKIQLERNEFVSYRLITEALFGKDHVYGYNTEPEDFLNADKEDILSFFKQNYDLKKSFAILSGKVSPSQQELIKNKLAIKCNQSISMTSSVANLTTQQGTLIEKKIENNLQSSIKIARRTFLRSHADFSGIYVLSTILGGYFGSRLMQSVREKHGFSYNIYSAIEMLEEEAYMCISSDVGSKYTKDALQAIFDEIDRLREEPVPEDELLMVKNYLLGKILRDLDGPFSSSTTLRNLLVTGGNMNNLPDFLNEIKSIESHTLQSLAKRYLDKKSFTTVIVS